MAVPLSATGRITIPITFSNYTHKMRVYCRNPQVVGATYNINTRATDANDEAWTDAVNGLVEATSYLYANTATFGDASLEIRSGTVWTLAANFTPSGATHFTGTNYVGWQFTWVLRDVNLKKVKLVQLEGNYNALMHVASYSGFGAGTWLSFVKEFTSNKTLTHAPWNWMVGRGNQYLHASSFVGLTVTPNRRTRRRRGLT